ncbi:MAG: 3-deoxy-manno-octulosonate cytidylyltransferase [Bacteriovorax sp.]|nr:3-deoxy-manno-octulosonate cytidylyltransferase [Bacteriovorax sp.]
MSKKSVLILIPARFASTRFPGKPLTIIAGKSMISRVLENCQTASHPNITFETFVVTDDHQVEAHIKTFSPNVVRVDDDVISGTLRIELAYARFFKTKQYDLIINVQGDEPLLEGSDLVRLAEFHLSKHFDITTLVKKNMNFDSVFHDPNKVKVAMSETTGTAFYFSRASIPFKRDAGVNWANDYWFLHIGVYSYKPEALSNFSKAPASRLEDLEKLEQLRALELGMTIGALETKSVVMGVDHPEDVLKVEEVINGRK